MVRACRSAGSTGKCQELVETQRAPINDPFDDTVNLCQKLIYALRLTLGGRLGRRNRPANQRLTIGFRPVERPGIRAILLFPIVRTVVGQTALGAATITAI